MADILTFEPHVFCIRYCSESGCVINILSMLVVATHLYISRTLIVYDDDNTDI